MKYKRCIGCGAYFIPESSRQRYCNPLCRERAKAKKAASEKSRRPERPVYEKVCKQCGKKFKTRTLSRVFCSENCGHKYEIQKHRECDDALRKTTVLDAQGIRSGMRRICPVCGKEYTVDEAHGTWCYCSMFCVREAMDRERALHGHARKPV